MRFSWFCWCGMGCLLWSACSYDLEALRQRARPEMDASQADADIEDASDAATKVADAGDAAQRLDAGEPGTAGAWLYVDADYTGADGDGSRARPFRDFADAARFASSNARVVRIVIAGSPEFNAPLEVLDGVSIHGGYTGAPAFAPDTAQRPRWVVSSDHYDTAARELVGAFAVGITTPTELRHIEVHTGDLDSAIFEGTGATNIAMRIMDSPALTLHDVHIQAGAGASGAPGSDADPPTDAMHGSDAQGRQPGAAPIACSAACMVATAARVEGQDSHVCGYGARATLPDFPWTPPLWGNPGDANGSVVGGMPGTSTGQGSADSSCNASPDDVSPGSPGTPGAQGMAGPDGVPGVRGVLTAQGVWQVDTASDGQPGARGSWGGGGGAAGGIYQGDCQRQAGGPGGGGGAPGCGGGFGRGGGGGGASIALAVVRSAGLVLSGSTLVSGTAGSGGAGGLGAAGGRAGQGETNVGALCQGAQTNEYSCNWNGGRGGDGGPGGHGGHGAGGAGGDSIAVYCVQSSISLTSVTLTPGTPGSGGTAPAALAGAPGHAGLTLGCD